MQCEESDKHVVCRDVDCSFFDAYSNNKKKKEKMRQERLLVHTQTPAHTHKKKAK